VDGALALVLLGGLERLDGEGVEVQLQLGHDFLREGRLEDGTERDGAA
jgi:hypothetical protein